VCTGAYVCTCACMWERCCVYLQSRFLFVVFYVQARVIMRFTMYVHMRTTTTYMRL